MSRKRIVLVYLGTLLALLTVTWLVLRESGIARSFVQQGLASVLEAKRFRFRTASIDAMSGTVRIAGLNVTTAEPGLIADIGSLAIGISTHPLRQPGQLRSVDLTDARLEIDLRDGRRPDWQSLLAARDDPDRSVSTLPAVALIDSTVVVHAERGRAPLTFAVDRLTATPLADAPERHVLEGTVRLVAGLPLAVRGTVSAAGGLEVRLSAADAPLAARDLAAIDPKLADQLAEIVTSSRIASFDAELGITPDGEVTWRVATVLDRLGFSSQHVPHAIQDATMRIWGDEAAGGTLRFDLDSESTYGDLRATGEWTGMYAAGSAIDVRLEADGVLVRPELGRALAPIDEAREVWDAFEPDGGRASAIARYRRDADGEQRFDLDLGLDGIGARFVGFESRSGARTYGFPHPLTDIHGTVRVRRGIVDVTDVRAAIAGRPLQVRGTVDISERGRPPRIALDFDAESLAFTAPLRDALAVLDRGSAQVWDRFEPAGDAGLQVRLRTDGSGGADVRVRIEPLLASARFAGFPCRVDQIRGAIDIGADAATLELQGVRGEAELELRGRLGFGPTPRDDEGGKASTFWVRGRGVAADAELRAALAALSPDLDTALDFLGVDVRADVEMSMWEPADAGTPSYDVRLDILDGRLDIERLGIPIRELRGPVVVHGDGRDAWIDVVGVRGRIDNAPGSPSGDVVVQGEVRTDLDGANIDLAAVVTGLELRDAVRDAVDRYGALDREVWDLIRPSGFVDLIWRQRGTSTLAASAGEQQLELQLRGVGVGADFLPDAAENLFGLVEVEDRRATFRDVVATMAGARVTLPSGSVVHADGQTVLEVEVQAERFPLDDRLGNVLPPGPLRDTWLERNVDGAIRVVPLRLRMEFPDDDPAAFLTSIEGTLEAVDVSFDLGARVVGASGQWTIDSAQIAPGGGVVRGNLERSAATVLGHAITKASMSFIADSERIRLRDVSARVHGGVVEGGSRSADDLVYRFGEPGELSFDVAWTDLSLDSMASVTGVRDRTLRGTVSGSFQLERLVGDRVFDAVGRGSIQVAEADLGEVPIFQTIYGYLEKPRRPRFDALSANVEIRDRTIAVSDLVVRSSLLDATGRGSIGMDGYVDMVVDFPDFFGSDADWLFLPQLVRSVSRRIVSFKVFGYLRNLRSQPLWLGLGAPERGPLQPVPPLRDAPR